MATVLTDKLDLTKFRTMQGTIIPDVTTYIKDYIDNSNEEIKIYIGTDSQTSRKSKVTLYATVICLHKIVRDEKGNIVGGKGSHLIFNKMKRKDVFDIFNKLSWEVEYSMQLANHLKDANVYLAQNLLSIHIDLSPNAENGSHGVYKYAMGYIKAMGYDVVAKPGASVASYAADNIVRL